MNTRRTGSPFDQWAEDNAEVVAFLCAEDFDAEGSAFLTDLASQVANRRALTPNQVNAVARNIVRRADRARRTSTPAPRAQTAEQAPCGRVTVEGVVTEVTTRPGFSADKPDYKMTVDCDGFQVWCTVPQALVLLPHAPDLGLTAARVRFAVTLEPSSGNPSIAVGKAPRRVTLLAAATERSGDSTRVA